MALFQQQPITQQIPSVNLKPNLLGNQLNQISNNYPRAQSLNAEPSKQIGQIGWGMDRSTLNESPRRIVLENQPHKSYFDRERYNQFLRANGNFARSIDRKTDTNYDQYQLMDMKTLRQMIKDKPNREPKRMKYLYMIDSTHETYMKQVNLDIDIGRNTLMQQLSNRLNQSSLNGDLESSQQNRTTGRISPVKIHQNGKVTIDSNLVNQREIQMQKIMFNANKSHNLSFNNTQRHSKLQGMSIREADDLSPDMKNSTAFKFNSFQKSRFSQQNQTNYSPNKDIIMSQSHRLSDFDTGRKTKIDKCPKMQKHLGLQNSQKYQTLSKIRENTQSINGSNAIYDNWHNTSIGQSFSKNGNSIQQNRQGLESNYNHNLSVQEDTDVLNGRYSNLSKLKGTSDMSLGVDQIYQSFREKNRKHKRGYSIEFNSKIPDYQKYFSMSTKKKPILDQSRVNFPSINTPVRVMQKLDIQQENQNQIVEQQEENLELVLEKQL
eukprot:403361094